VSRYDGQEFVNFTAEDGLVDNNVRCILEDRQGHLWFGTSGGGISKYDGLVFQNMLKRDGLVNNMVHRILQDRNGNIWIATEGGVIRYRPCHTPPRIRITDLVADRRYGPVDELRVPVSRSFITFEFQGRSLYTDWDRMAYVYRLEGYDEEWRATREGRVEYADLSLGEYEFQVKAVDRDLNYSEPAAVRIIVEPDPREEALTEALRGVSEEFVGTSEALHRMKKQLA